jgi:capsular exopolysaccharide synthesis family protein
MKEQYLARNTRLISTEAQLNELMRSRSATLANAGQVLRQAYASACGTESKLEAELHEQEQKALELNRLEIPVKSLRRDIESNRTLYDALLKRLKETNVTQDFDKNYLRVVEAPLVAEKPAWPRKSMVLVLALCGGLLMGTGSVITADLLGGAFRGVAQVEETLGARVLTTVAIGRRRDGELITQSNPESEVAEAFRWLRISMQLRGERLAPRSVVFVGAEPGDGTTFCAANYAVTLALQGRRVLLIDGDLRKPRLQRLFQAKPEGSVADVLSGESTLEQAVVNTATPGLSLLAASGPVRHAGQLLERENWAAVLQEALGQFEHVVIDTAPLQAFSDTLTIAPEAEAVCIVVRTGRTSRAAAERACGMLALAQAKLAGVILNGLGKGQGRALDS